MELVNFSTLKTFSSFNDKIFENLGQLQFRFFKGKKSVRPSKPEMYFKTLKISEISLNWVRQPVDKTHFFGALSSFKTRDYM